MLEYGRIAEYGSAATVLATPRSRFGARFAGVNLVSGTRAPTVRYAPSGDGLARQRRPGRGRGQAGGRGLSRRGVAVYRDKPHGSPRNTVEVRWPNSTAAGGPSRARRRATRRAPGLAADITAESAPNCGWCRGSAFTSPSRRRRSRFTPLRNGGRTRVDQVNEPRAYRAGHSSCQQHADSVLAAGLMLPATSQLITL
jgi:hypothetical protein